MVPTAVGERKLMDLAHSLGVGHGCLVWCLTYYAKLAVLHITTVLVQVSPTSLYRFITVINHMFLVES